VPLASERDEREAIGADGFVKILYIINEDWFFVSHFLGIARRARDAGHEIGVAARIQNHGDFLRAEGFRVFPVGHDRGKLGPLRAFSAMSGLYRLIRAERPDLVHIFTTQSIVYAAPMARLAGVGAIALAPTGLGYLWTEKGIFSFLGRQVVRFAMRVARGAPKVMMFFENLDDPKEFGLDAASDPRIVILGGAGVEPAEFPTLPAPAAPPVRIAMVSRMLRFKGAADAVAAVEILRARGHDVELELWGSPDPDNRRAILVSELEAWSALPGISWRGHTKDIASVWRNSHIAMLLSHGGDGLPRSLVEAAASGRPIVTTDVAGCRAVVNHGVEGLLVPPKDPAAVADALEGLLTDPELREKMGRAARRRFEAEFTADIVAEKVNNTYLNISNPL
jgi:glycosyltransferase involved in cell wall biosynthesis